MDTNTLPMRTFEVALSADDGLVRIKRAGTGRVTLALSVDEATQIRAGIKGALQSNTKKRSNKGKKRRR